LRRALRAVAVLAALSGCRHAPESPSAGSVRADAGATLETEYHGLAADGGRTYRIDPAASRVRIFAFRGGRLARVGHNHVLVAPEFTGYAWVPAAGIDAARFDLVFRLDQMKVDDPLARREAGAGFADILDAAAIAGTQVHMLGPDNLDAARFPLVAVHSLTIAGELPHLIATVALTLHGVTHELLVPLHAQVDSAMLLAGGAFALRQTDYGVSPYSVLGGALAVQNEVMIEFDLVARRAF